MRQSNAATSAAGDADDDSFPGCHFDSSVYFDYLVIRLRRPGIDESVLCFSLFLGFPERCFPGNGFENFVKPVKCLLRCVGLVVYVRVSIVIWV